jgi:TatD DNase family protein
MELIDTHCHLTHPRLVPELGAVLERARAAGLAGVITIGTAIADGRAARELSRAHADVAASIGLDPFGCHAAGAAVDEHLQELERLLSAGGFVAVGEIGLEYHHQLLAHPRQQELLERQLELAVRLTLPAILHVRDAHHDMLPLLARHPRARGVVHSFDGDRAQAEAYLALGWHLAINGMVTFKPKHALREAARAIPNDRLLVETDSPYLAPVPLRGERCEPAFVVHTLRHLAELRGQRLEDLAAWTTRNARRLFALPSGPPAPAAG